MDDDQQDDLTLVYMWAFRKGEEKSKARTEALEAALRQCHDALEVAFDYNDGDVFGIHHNDAVDAVMTAKNILGVK